MGPPTCSLYLIGVGVRRPHRGRRHRHRHGCERFRRGGLSMRLQRLAGIHHDSSCIVVSGRKATCIIDPGTSWYQVNLLERLKPHLEDRPPVASILLSHRHFDTCGAAPYLASELGANIRIHSDAIAPLAGADMFTTWASRYGSDMPSIDALALDDGEIIELGDTELHVLHTPGHTVDSCVFHIPSKHVIICGDLVPAAGHPVRADMPTGALMDLKSSLETVRDLHPNMLVCGRGDAISGHDVCASVLTYHIQSVDERITAKGEIPSGWPKPAETCHWLTPEPSWNFD